MKLLVALIFSAVAIGPQFPALANHDTYLANNYYQCFKVKGNKLVVKENLTAKQKEFLTLARFASAQDLLNYKVYNSIQNQFKSCITNRIEVNGFTSKQVGKYTFEYKPQKIKAVFVSNGEKTEVDLSNLTVKVRSFYNRKTGVRTLDVTI